MEVSKNKSCSSGQEMAAKAAELGMGCEVQKDVTAMVSEAVSEPTAAEKEREERLAELASMRVMSCTDVEPEEPALTVDDVGVFALSDIHAIKGKQKCGKTTALKVCLAAWMQGSQFRLVSGLECPKILYLDTEQKRSDVKLIVEDVIYMTGLPSEYVDEHMRVYGLRRRDYNMLLDDMKLLIDDFKPQVVIVDGIVEFVASFNDESLAKQLIHELLRISEDHRLAMVCVLHTNKADEDHNMRGHLGTMLAQKAGTVLECKKQGDVINVTCSDARHQEMPDWSIAFEDGRIVDADERRKQLLEQHRLELEMRRQKATEEKQKYRLEQCLRIIKDKGGAISRKQLTEILVNMLELKRPTIASLITGWLNDNTIVEINDKIQSAENIIIPF